MIFLVRLTQLKIGYGWESMAHIWNEADLRKPLSIAKPPIHSLNAMLELILGRHRCAASAPPVSQVDSPCSCGHFGMRLTYVGLLVSKL